MFHLNQIIASNNVLSKYREGVRYAIMQAPCQSGKTGTFQKLIRDMLSMSLIERAYVVCGSAETRLRDQANEDTQNYNNDFFDAGKISIVFHSAFGKTTMNIQNTLIVLDESHLVQTVGQKLELFFYKHGITMDGNPQTLERNNTYILTVSATGWSELSTIVYAETKFPKYIETLIPGEGYKGADEFTKQFKVQKTYNIGSEKGYEQFERLIQQPKYKKKWLLVRLKSSEFGLKAEYAIIKICMKHEINYAYYSSLKAEIPQIALTKFEDRKGEFGILVGNLEEQPEKTTVVFIRECLRAGKVVPKKYIGFVWEGSKMPKTDSLYQGLPGRMMGYEYGTALPDIFIPRSILGLPDDAGEDDEYEDEYEDKYEEDKPNIPLYRKVCVSRVKAEKSDIPEWQRVIDAEKGEPFLPIRATNINTSGGTNGRSIYSEKPENYVPIPLNSKKKGEPSMRFMELKQQVLQIRNCLEENYDDYDCPCYQPCECYCDSSESEYDNEEYTEQDYGKFLNARGIAY
jgi:hypothetical protein